MNNPNKKSVQFTPRTAHLHAPATLAELAEARREQQQEEDPRWPLEVVEACGFDPEELFNPDGSLK